jgi:hypothetical protein
MRKKEYQAIIKGEKKAEDCPTFGLNQLSEEDIKKAKLKEMEED